MRPTAAYGLYASRTSVESAITGLQREGLLSQDISVLFPGNEDSRRFARQNGTMPPAGTMTGSTAEAPLEGSLGILDPARGPKEGALPGALRGMGIPEEEAHEYGERVKEGGILVSVRCESPEDVAHSLDVLTRTGAHFVSSNAINRAPEGSLAR
jgi:hypothetical protein